MSNTKTTLISLLQRVRSCTHCASSLPFPPRPVLRAGSTSRILIIGQAPGTRVHASGIPWDDPSGKRLRSWMGIDDHTFYDESRISIVPMGFCYPGKGKSGDLPPRPECAPKWHAEILNLLPEIKLTLLIGQYSQKYYLGHEMEKNLTETVRTWQKYTPRFLPLPHPSPRNIRWFKQNPWFDAEVVPYLQNKIRSIL